MKKQKPTISQTQPPINSLSDDSLSSEWQLHSNRLNFLEQSMAKVQKKLTKLQKNYNNLSQSSTELKQDFRSKLNQMIAIVSQPQQISVQNLVSSDQFSSVMSQVKQLSDIQSECLFNCSNLQRQLHKLADKTSQHNQLKDYINNRIAAVEIKSKKFIEDKLLAVTQTLNELQKTKPYTHHILNNSAFSKASSHALSNSRSQNKLSNSRSFNLFECPEPILQSVAVKRLTFAQDEQVKKYKESSVACQKSSVPTNENSSRVVYLRQKLKQFQEINKKYEKKQTQYEQKQMQMTSHNNSKSHQHQMSTKKNSNSQHSNYEQNGKHQHQQVYSSSSQQASIKRHQKRQGQVTASYKEQQSKKYSAVSSGKTQVMSHESSAKKVDKLKSIKDYLQQTQSQIEDSFLEPNYHARM